MHDYKPTIQVDPSFSTGDHSFNPRMAAKYGFPVACLYRQLEEWMRCDLHDESNLDEEGRAWISYSCA